MNESTPVGYRARPAITRAGPTMKKWLLYQRVPVSRIRILRLEAESRFWLAYTAAYVGLAAVCAQLILAFPMPILGAAAFNQDVWYTVFFKIGALLVLPVMILARMGYRPADLLPEWRPRRLVYVAAAFAMGLLLNGSWWPRIHEAIDARGAEALPLVMLGALLPLLTAALPEEIVFRGVLQTRLEAWWGRLPAIAVTALLFTAWHLPTRYFLASGVEGTAGDLGSVLVGTGLPVFIVGLVFGLVWDRYRALLPLIAIHWSIDLPPTVGSMLGVGM